MKTWLSIMMAAGLLLYPFAAFAADYGSQSSQTPQDPPVAQTLVREGDFAVKLAAQLGLGSPRDEAVAEEMLVKTGVAPLNGWISDYPMTPQIIGQLQDAIVTAAAEGSLPMSAEEAKKGLNDLAAQMNLPTPASIDTGESEGPQAPVAQSTPGVVNNYYYDQGPPIITYYPPPVHYAYLYAWVPYPSWWFGFWFPGFFISHNFTTVVVFNSFDGHGHWKRGIVSNRVIDRHTRRVARVDPTFTSGKGKVRPETTLRTDRGERFRHLSEMRQGVGVSRPPAGRTERSDVFKSPDARKSAGAIYSRSVEDMSSRRVQEGGRNRGGERRYATPNASGKSFSAPSRSGQMKSIAPDRTGNAPTGGRSYTSQSRGNELKYGTTERSYRSPGTRGTNDFGKPAVRLYTPRTGEGYGTSMKPSGRSFSGSSTRGGRGSDRSFTDNGWRGR